jgi:hypothetical protein
MHDPRRKKLRNTKYFLKKNHNLSVPEQPSTGEKKTEDIFLEKHFNLSKHAIV